MKKLALCMALSVALVSFASASTRHQAKTFNPAGYFLPMKSSQNASRVRWILLSDYRSPRSIGRLYVELRIGNHDHWITFAQNLLSIAGEQLHFATKTRNGLRYDFRGRFLLDDVERSSGRFSDDGRDASPALRGVLRTFRRNRIVRSEKLIFFYTVGD